MKVMIFGAKGMLGQELMKSFFGCDVIGLDKKNLDVTDQSAVQSRVAWERPSIVINASAINAVDKIEESREWFELAKKVNAAAPGYLAKICRDLGAIFVHYSSDYVFAGEDKNGYREDSNANPVNKYGVTKAAGEEAVREIGGKFYLIRLSKLFGKPAASVDAKRSFVDTMLRLATEGGKTILEVVEAEISSPTYAPDLAKLTKNIIEARRPFGIYHGTNGGACSWHEWAKQIFELKKLPVRVSPVPLEKFPRPAPRPRWSELINTKLPPQRSWQAALEEYLC